MKENFVETYRELECLEGLDLDHVVSVVTREHAGRDTRDLVKRFRHGNKRGVPLARAIFKIINHFYSAMTEWLRMESNEHYISLDGDETTQDIIGSETIEGEVVNLIILNLDDFIISRENDEINVDMVKMIEKTVYLMLYTDMMIKEKDRRSDVSVDFMKTIIEDVSGFVVEYLEKIVDDVG